MLQQRTPLFKTPLEIRLDIYALLIPHEIHIRFSKNKLQVSPCLATHLYNSDRVIECWAFDTGKFRVESSGEEVDREEVRARRLRSSWGPHFRCEERANDVFLNQDCLDSLLQVCRQMRVVSYSSSLERGLLMCLRLFEVLDFVAMFSEVHVNDLETLKHLEEPLQTSLPPQRLFSSALSHLSRLNITLKLPLNFYHTLDSAGPIPQDLTDDIHTWRRLETILGTLKHLKSLYLWLDHDDTCSWSVVNERAILSSITQLAAAYLTDLVIHVTLPKLHPKFEEEARHFLPKQNPNSFQLHRFIRQDEHGSFRNDGRLEVTRKPDFPIMLEVMFFYAENMTAEEIEAWERKLWEKGDDVEAELRYWENDLGGCQLHSC
jgi:hypothetical protein